MSAGTLALLAGLFVVPVVLLWLGHRLRRRPARLRGAFWGGVIGYGIASVAALVAGMYPPAEWSDGDVVRGLLGFWLLLIAPLVGAVLGAVSAREE